MAHTPSLQAKLAASLPFNHRFTLHHLSTPPTPCPALYSAPPGQKPEKTYSESHFLSVSITPQSQQQTQILALEVLIYTTAHLTTIFVAKADSTGYLYLLHLPKGTPSPLKTISSTFLSHLVAHRQRKDRKLVVSLFARAQDQYLFPGSVENPHKHVLDDRGLVKWWCRVLEPVLRAGSTWHSSSSPSSPSSPHHKERKSITSAYLRVPGCDIHETRSFFPSSVRLAPTTTLASKWHPSRDPLRDLNRSPAFPERCLIPRFPDDPKSRFVDELDEELTEPPPSMESSQQQARESPSKGKRPGRWRSVRSLEQFWELMAFRQECSSGRLVGFLWGFFEPEGMRGNDLLRGECEGSPSRKSTLPTPAGSQDQAGCGTSSSQQRTSSSSPSSKTSQPQNRPEKTTHYFWHPSTRGTVVLPQKHYDRVNKLLLHLDYATLEVAAESTKRWVEDVAMCAGRSEGWGIEIVGEMPLPAEDEGVVGQRKEGGTVGEVNVLAAGMVRKKKRAVEGEGVDGDASVGGDGGVQILSAGLVKKKPKIR